MENILVDVQVNAAIITINRPKQLNALNQRTIEETVSYTHLTLPTTGSV